MWEVGTGNPQTGKRETERPADVRRATCRTENSEPAFEEKVPNKRSLCPHSFENTSSSHDGTHTDGLLLADVSTPESGGKKKNNPAMGTGIVSDAMDEYRKCSSC